MRERKAPYRPRSDKKRASEVYTDGFVQICDVTDGAVPGLLPRPVLTEKIKLAYQELKLGVQRYYQAKQNQIHVERVIRVPRSPIEITNQDAAITEDGRRYRIDMIQTAKDVWPPSLDLTLTAYTQRQGGNTEPVPFDPPGGEVDR